MTAKFSREVELPNTAESGLRRGTKSLRQFFRATLEKQFVLTNTCTGSITCCHTQCYNQYTDELEFRLFDEQFRCNC